MAKLDETELEVLRARYGKIGVRDWGEHQIIFRKANRQEVRDYRRKLDSAAEKPDAMDQLAQSTIVAFDGNQDPNAARVQFTSVFLEAYPAFTMNSATVAILSLLTGITANEEDLELGKGASVRTRPPRSTPTVSPPGSDTSSVATNN
jgi:hypothetical protein